MGETEWPDTWSHREWSKRVMKGGNVGVIMGDNATTICGKSRFLKTEVLLGI